MRKSSVSKASHTAPSVFKNTLPTSKLYCRSADIMLEVDYHLCRLSDGSQNEHWQRVDTPIRLRKTPHQDISSHDES